MHFIFIKNIFSLSLSHTHIYMRKYIFYKNKMHFFIILIIFITNIYLTII
jgi:hypothetical protein